MDGGGQEGYRRRIVRIEYEEIEGVGPEPRDLRNNPGGRDYDSGEPPRAWTSHPPASRRESYTPPARQITAKPSKKDPTLGESCCGLVIIFGLATAVAWVGLWAWNASSVDNAKGPSSVSPTRSNTTNDPAPIDSSATSPTASPAQQAPSAPPSARPYTPSDEEALRLLHQARESRAAHDLDTAARHLRAAQRLAEHPALSQRIARELREVNRLR